MNILNFKLIFTKFHNFKKFNSLIFNQFQTQINKQLFYSYSHFKLIYIRLPLIILNYSHKISKKLQFFATPFKKFISPIFIWF